MTDDQQPLSPLNRIRIEVDRDLCIGSGDCVASAPKVFELDDEGKAIVLDPDGAPTDDVVEAAMNCPVTAIFVVGEDGEIYPSAAARRPAAGARAGSGRLRAWPSSGR